MTMQPGPTPMPGNPNNDVYVHPNLLGPLAQNFSASRLRRGYQNIVHQELSDLGRVLVPEVRKRSPKSSGHMARSTKWNVRAVHIADAGDLLYELTITQPAASIPVSAGSDLTRRYHYWYTVHHGMQPAGRLKGAFPPEVAIRPWVIRSVKSISKWGKEVRRIARAIAWKIYKEGIPPNLYLRESLEAKMPRIQEAANRIGRTIAFDLTRLPDIHIPED